VAQRSGSTSSSSPSSNSISSTFSTPKESSSSDPEVHREIHNPSVCPKTMDEVQRHIIETGPSFFAPAALQKREDSIFGPMVSCKGTNLPKTEKSDKNFEVLSAWRTITSNPRFKVSVVVCLVPGLDSYSKWRLTGR
jgi:AP-1-like factor